MSIQGAIGGALKGASFGFMGGGAYGAVIGAVIGFVIGAFTGPGGIVGLFADDPSAPGAPELQKMSYTSNTIGTPVADVLGTTKLIGTLLWFGGEHNEAVTQDVGGGKGGGGGGTSITGYKYYMSWAIGLCMGETDELLTVFRNEDMVWSGNLLRPESGGEETIVIPDIGRMTFYFGTADHVANTAMGALLADPTLNTPYRGLCWVYFDDCYIGDYNRMPTMRFVLRKTPVYAFSADNVLGSYDYNPAHAYWHILRTLTGLPESWLDTADFTAIAATLAGEVRGISMLMDNQDSALNYLESINSHIDAIIRYGSDGAFHPKLIRDDYDAGELLSIDEQDILDDPVFSRKSWIDTINELKVQYSQLTLPSDTWEVDGVPWTGAVVTVGAGKDYEDLVGAVYATDADALYLIYPGSYDAPGNVGGEWAGYKHLYKGMGKSYADVIIDVNGAITKGNKDIYFEWVTIDGMMTTDLYVTEALGELVVSKCYSPVGPWVNLNYLDRADLAHHTTFRYYQNSINLLWFILAAYDARQDNIYIHKCVLPSYLILNNSSHPFDGTIAESDFDVSSADGYGPDYGDFLIARKAVSSDIKQATADPVAVDIGNKEIQGRIASKTIQMALFTTNDNAVWAGGNNLRKESYPFAFVNFPVNRAAFRLEVGDCFKFSYALYGVTDLICRVLQISEEGPESEQITIQAMEDFYAIANAITTYSAVTSHAIPAPDYTESPLVHQTIVEAPYAAAAGNINLLPLAARSSALALGYDVYMSIDGGASYTFLKRITALLPYGTLVGTYPANTFKIDDALGLTIDFSQGASQIETTTFDQVLAGLKNTALLGDEIISFQTITPVSGTQYKLENVIRGRYDTIRQDHVEGTEFYCLPWSALQTIAGTELATGAARKFKFVPYNLKVSGSIADATALNITIAGRALTPYVPANLQANGGAFAARYDDDIVLTWSPRYRGKGAGLGLPGTVLAETDREGLFKVEVYVAAALVRTTDAIDAATWTYTAAMNIADNGAAAASVTFKVSNYRVESGNTYESDQAEVVCKKN